MFSKIIICTVLGENKNEPFSILKIFFHDAVCFWYASCSAQTNVPSDRIVRVHCSDCACKSFSFFRQFAVVGFHVMVLKMFWNSTNLSIHFEEKADFCKSLNTQDVEFHISIVLSMLCNKGTGQECILIVDVWVTLVSLSRGGLIEPPKTGGGGERAQLARP